MTIPASANIVISNGGYPGPPGPPGGPLTPAAVQSAGFAAAPGQLIPCNTTSGPLTDLRIAANTSAFRSARF